MTPGLGAEPLVDPMHNMKPRHLVHWKNTGSFCLPNRGMRNSLHQVIENGRLWRDIIYLVKKTSTADGEWATCDKRELMYRVVRLPVLSLPCCIRNCQPWPAWPIVNHKWDWVYTHQSRTYTHTPTWAQLHTRPVHTWQYTLQQNTVWC